MAKLIVDLNLKKPTVSHFDPDARRQSIIDSSLVNESIRTAAKMKKVMVKQFKTYAQAKCPRCKGFIRARLVAKGHHPFPHREWEKNMKSVHMRFWCHTASQNGVQCLMSIIE